MASLAEYALQNQLRTAGTEAVLQANQQFQNVIGDVQKAQKQKADEAKRQEIVKQASAQWQSGAKDQAMSTLMQGDPETFKAAFGERSKLQAESEYGQLPTQVAGARAQSIAKGKGFQQGALEVDGNVIPVAFESATGKYWYPGTGEAVPAEVVMRAQKGFRPSIRSDKNTDEAVRITAGGKATPIASPSQIIEKTPDGGAVSLNAKQNDGLTKESNAFNKDKQTQELVTQINSLDMAKRAIINNAPGGQVLEQMRLIRGVTPRPAVQEVMALNYGKGWETQLESYGTKAAGEGMSGQEQKNFFSMLETFQNANLDAYNQHLHSNVARIAGSYKVDPSIVLKRVAPEMPTPIQENARKLGQASPADQEAVQWAHQTLLNYKSPKEDSDKALKILQLHGL